MTRNCAIKYTYPNRPRALRLSRLSSRVPSWSSFASGYSPFSRMWSRSTGARIFACRRFSVSQQEVEYYRSLKFVPIGSPGELNGGSYPNVRTRMSADQVPRQFSISVVIDNDPYTDGIQTNAQVPDATCTFKEITITVTPTSPEKAGSWTATPQTISIQRVRYN